ncbi:MAG TPA: DUF5658 family protein [Pyrinomonadaceae bacterium]|jgi:hypothetical protein
MNASAKCLLLFALNWLDAQLTIIWIRGGWATEGNALMSHLLDAGDLPFLLTKLAIGAFVAVVLFRWSHLALARRGLTGVLGLYVALMFVHAATAFSAFGWHAHEKLVAYVAALPDGLFALLS